VLVLAQLAAAAQSKQGFVINGKVTSFEESLPLEGASIVVKGGSNATGTQADGTFSLFIGPGDSLLVISLAGYENKEIRTNAKNKQYDIVLRRSDNAVTYLSVPRVSSTKIPARQPTGNYLPSALLSGNR
ncbi:MAG: carboxypeptidase-like regulatory domain-containing protein, partial [Bacteroidetes bacterium]|nr:carboxypeptidase-like regulatory domain-containing protein [Bacteroidota bacterium]